MNRSTTVAIADAMTAVRADWQQGGCIAQIQVAAHTWQGTDAELAAHCLAVAADPAARTPAAVNATAPAQTRTSAKAGQAKEPTCYICARSRTECRWFHDFEVRHGLPDPHHFETAEEADANSGHIQFDPTMLALAATPKINDHEDSPERAAAKARARQAAADAQAKSKWKPAPEPDQRKVQEPWPQPDPKETPA